MGLSREVKSDPIEGPPSVPRLWRRDLRGLGKGKGIYVSYLVPATLCLTRGSTTSSSSRASTGTWETDGGAGTDGAGGTGGGATTRSRGTGPTGRGWSTRTLDKHRRLPPSSRPPRHPSPRVSGHGTPRHLSFCTRSPDSHPSGAGRVRRRMGGPTGEWYGVARVRCRGNLIDSESRHVFFCRTSRGPSPP